MPHQEAKVMVRFDSQPSLHRAGFQLLVIFPLLSLNLLEIVGGGMEAECRGRIPSLQRLLVFALLCCIVSVIAERRWCGTGLVTQIRGVGPDRTQFLLAGDGAPAASPSAWGGRRGRCSQGGMCPDGEPNGDLLAHRSVLNH